MVEELWKIGHPVPEDYRANKYCLLAQKHPNYRLVMLNDILQNKEITLPTFVTSFIAREGAAIMIGNIVRGRCISVLLRSVKQKAFIDVGYSKGVFYGIGQLGENFKYGTPIVVVEGIADCDALKEIYPAVIAVKSSSLSLLQVSLLASLTNKVIIALDNDTAGEKGARLAEGRLHKLGVHTMTIKHPREKDSGSIYDYLYLGNKTKSEEIKNDYQVLIRGAIACLRD